MKSLGRIFLRGLLTVLPVALTVWLLAWLGSLLERTLGGLLRLALPDEWYLPGFGLLAGALIIFVVGLAARAWLGRELIAYFERRIDQLPLVKNIYGTFRDFAHFFKQEDRGDGLGRPVLVEMNGAKLVGFVTGDAGALGLPDELLVYLPMGYQLGGYTLALPPDAVSDITTMNTQEAMRFALTAGITGASRKDSERGEGR